MKVYHTIVNGNRFQAAQAAAARGIPLVFCCEHQVNAIDGLKTRSRGRASMEHGDKLFAWYHEIRCAEDAEKIGALLSFHGH